MIEDDNYLQCEYEEQQEQKIKILNTGQVRKFEKFLQTKMTMQERFHHLFVAISQQSVCYRSICYWKGKNSKNTAIQICFSFSVIKKSFRIITPLLKCFLLLKISIFSIALSSSDYFEFQNFYSYFKRTDQINFSKCFQRPNKFTSQKSICKVLKHAAKFDLQIERWGFQKWGKPNQVHEHKRHQKQEQSCKLSTFFDL